MGMVAAIVVAKQLYGGLGHNPFNPAMVGYALLLVSFPTYMTLWTPPQNIVPTELWSQITGTLPAAQLDSLSGATPLDAFKHKGEAVLASEFWAAKPLPEGTLGAWQIISLAWLLGGTFLLYKRIISWHIPAAMLVVSWYLRRCFISATQATLLLRCFTCSPGQPCLGRSLSPPTLFLQPLADAVNLFMALALAC
ncbi:hypothetical protein HSBAA_28490 [Vreelandella sulfidaeris]|uniref:Electron transport complex subunit RsxD n=1 Tax=Vreelandella sulfidaeris TaxID=115553 RepID=A0A455U8J7_9GAMM|nr:hypothetical protein HSBAA_28490 [Halomonas sulfidaeris]